MVDHPLFVKTNCYVQHPPSLQHSVKLHLSKLFAQSVEMCLSQLRVMLLVLSVFG